MDEEEPQGTHSPGPGVNPDRQPIPLAERKFDWVFLGFFLFNLFFITYFVDVEQDWIRLPTIIYATILFTNVVIILFEEKLGIHKADNFAMVFGSNLAWLVFPVLLVIRMWPSEYSCTRTA